MITLLVMMQKF